ncbi:unnamed protein product, partial [Prorocentrum cordatum]
RGERSRAALDGDLLVQDGRRAARRGRRTRRSLTPQPSLPPVVGWRGARPVSLHFCAARARAGGRGASSGCHSARRAGGGAGPPRARADGRREEAGAPESAAGPRTAPLRGSACGTRGCSGP